MQGVVIGGLEEILEEHIDMFDLNKLKRSSLLLSQFLLEPFSIFQILLPVGHERNQ